MKKSLCDCCHEARSLISVGIHGVDLCKSCIASAYYLMRLAKKECRSLPEKDPMTKGEIMRAIASQAKTDNLGAHLYGWSGTDLKVLFRDGGEVRTFKLPDGSSSDKVNDARRAIRAAAKSLPTPARTA